MTLLAHAAPAGLSMPVVWETAVARWLLLAGLAVALGGLAGRGLARQYKGTFPRPLPAPWALRGSLAGLVGSGWLALITTGTNRNAALAELVAFAVAALLLRLRQPGWSVVPLLAVVVAEGIRAHPETIVPVVGALITYCHLIPAMLWAGMLVYVLRTAISWRDHPEQMRGLIRLYAAAAAWLFAFLVITGVISALVLVPLGSLLTTTYGRVLIVKAALVAVAAGMAVAGRVWLRHRPQPGAGPARATRLELAVLAAVLAVTALLTALTPPATPIRPASAARPAAVRPAATHPAAVRAATAGPAAVRAATD
ncbi:MAG TPA: CopD family protein [Streptosporangiaceae bacterium]|nr:CopD family protein [Streptosporangiaceae bacterium]